MTVWSFWGSPNKKSSNHRPIKEQSRRVVTTLCTKQKKPWDSATCFRWRKPQIRCLRAGRTLKRHSRRLVWRESTAFEVISLVIGTTHRLSFLYCYQWYNADNATSEQRKERNEKEAEFEQKKAERAERKSKLSEKWAANRSQN